MPSNSIVDYMKDRIKKVMESQHMSQQVFADFIGLGAATLSGIFNDRTRPTLNVVEAIKKKIPDISTDWLMFGEGPMYMSSSPASEGAPEAGSAPQTGVSHGQAGGPIFEPTLEFGQSPSPTPSMGQPVGRYYNGVRNTHPEMLRDEIKYIDKPQRRVTEIRVYYDDQTWESFVPSKK